MATQQNTPIWEPDIKEIDVTDDVLGGTGGPPNIPLQQLTSRTSWLKKAMDSLRPLGTLQFLLSSNYNGANYDTNGTGLAGTEAEGWQLCNGYQSEDFRGRVPLGFDPAANSNYGVGAFGGEEKHTLTIDEIPPHNHTGGVSQARFAYLDGQTTLDSNTDSSTNEPNLSRVANIQTQGGGQSHNNMQPWRAVLVRQWVG